MHHKLEVVGSDIITVVIWPTHECRSITVAKVRRRFATLGLNGEIHAITAKAWVPPLQVCSVAAEVNSVTVFATASLILLCVRGSIRIPALRSRRTGATNRGRIGRFSSPDPLSGSTANPQSLNHYAYVGNDTINAIDQSGADMMENCGAGPAMGYIDQTCDGETWALHGGGSGGGINFGTDAQAVPYDEGDDSEDGYPPDPSTDPCAGLGPNGGSVAVSTSFGIVNLNFNASGNLSGFNLPLTGSMHANGEGDSGWYVPQNTRAGANLNADGSVTIGFTNPVLTNGIAGAWIQQATFSEGAFTSAIGAPALLGIAIGFTSTPSSTVQDGLNNNSGALEVGGALQKILQFTSSHVGCEDLLGG